MPEPKGTPDAEGASAIEILLARLRRLRRLPASPRRPETSLSRAEKLAYAMFPDADTANDDTSRPKV